MLQVNSTITSPSTRTTDYLLIRTENRIYFFMNWRKVSLFLSGLFLGGAIDHVILALMKSPLTPYGVNVGVTGNWGLGLFDLLVAALFYLLHRYLEYASTRRAL